MSFSLPETILQKVYSQAETEYPSECCGIISSTMGKDAAFEIYPCENVQDIYHEKNSLEFPQTSRNAYFINPKQLLDIQNKIHEFQHEMKVIYHSHIDASDYFSEIDQKFAAPDGEPLYPYIVYLVISVYKGKAQRHKYYGWDEERKKYIEN